MGSASIEAEQDLEKLQAHALRRMDIGGQYSPAKCLSAGLKKDADAGLEKSENRAKTATTSVPRPSSKITTSAFM